MINERLMNMVLESGVEALAYKIQVAQSTGRLPRDLTAEDVSALVERVWPEFSKEASLNYSIVASGLLKPAQPAH